MLYCVNCGAEVGGEDRFCGRCGTPQTPFKSSPKPPPIPDPLHNFSDRNIRLFCYIPWLGWIASIVVLASERFRRDDRSRFHAFQGLYLFAAWVLADWLISPALFGFLSPVQVVERAAKLVIV